MVSGLSHCTVENSTTAQLRFQASHHTKLCFDHKAHIRFLHRDVCVRFTECLRSAPIGLKSLSIRCKSFSSFFVLYCIFIRNNMGHMLAHTDVGDQAD